MYLQKKLDKFSSDALKNVNNCFKFDGAIELWIEPEIAKNEI